MKKIRVGIIGLGNQGSYYANRLFAAGAIQNGVITAMCDINKAKIENMKTKFTDETVTYFEDYKQMLDSGLCDAVLIETPHYLHPEIAMECFKRNIHVICEKPFTLTKDEALELFELAKKNNRFLME